jgi:Arc/MetJ-type ribon-helix-helix transcriptional regulator
MAREIQMNIRISEDEAAAIDRHIESGDFDTRTEFVRFAIRKVLDAYEPGQRIGFKL